MLTEERHRLHALPEAPYTAALGETRKVSWSSTISFGGGDLLGPAHVGR